MREQKFVAKIPRKLPKCIVNKMDDEMLRRGQQPTGHLMFDLLRRTHEFRVREAIIRRL